MKIVPLDRIEESFRIADFDDPFVIPTETVYGLAARIDREDALKRIYEIKGRPSDNPLIVHVSSQEMLRELIADGIPAVYVPLIERFWPGPLTLVFKCRESLSKTVRGSGSDTVAVRMPKSAVLRRLIERIGVPLAAPSANTSGRPSPTAVGHAIDDLGDKVSLYIDDGPCEVGLESTVLGMIDAKAVLLRPGVVTREALEDALGISIELRNTHSPGQRLLCPGQKYRHYSPAIPVYLFKGVDWQGKMKKIQEGMPGKKIGVMVPSASIGEVEAFKCIDLGESITDCCKSFFAGLRELDKTCDAIFAVTFSTDHEGLAIMDRLGKAATYVIE